MSNEYLHFNMLQWSTDDEGRGIAWIGGRVYTHEEVRALRSELDEVLKIGDYDAQSECSGSGYDRTRKGYR